MSELDLPQLLLIAAGVNILAAFVTALRAGRARAGAWAVALGLGLAAANLLLAQGLRVGGHWLSAWWLIFAVLPGLLLPLWIALANISLLRRSLLWLNAIAGLAALGAAAWLHGAVGLDAASGWPRLPPLARWLGVWAGVCLALALLDLAWQALRAPHRRQRLSWVATVFAGLGLGGGLDWLSHFGFGLGPWGFIATGAAQLVLSGLLWVQRGPRRISGTIPPAILAASRQALLIADGEGRIQAANPAAARLLDTRRQRVLGAELAAVTGLNVDQLDTASRLHGAGYVERIVLGQGDRKDLRELAVQPQVLRAQDGEVLAVLLSLATGSEDPSLAATSLADPVTGLAGAALGEALLAQELRRHAGGGGPLVAAVFVRLDDAGGIAARHGQIVHDKLQAAVAERLAAVCDWPVDLARTDGGGFLMLLTQVTDAAEVMAIAERAHAQVNAPYPLAGETLNPPAMVAVLPDLRLYHEVVDLLGDARHALAQARHAPAAPYRCEQRARQRIDLAMALETAIANDALDLCLEPVVDLTRERVLGARATLQWPVEGLPLIQDDELRRLARRVHLEGPLNQWRLRQAAKLRCPAGFAIWLPVAVEDLQQAGFRKTLPASAERFPHKLLLELPDLAWALPAVHRVAGELVAGGIGLHASEFSGAARVLTQAAGAVPKAASLDPRLVQEHGPATDALLKGLVASARALKLALRAEGVRKRADVRRLRLAGVALASGDYFGPPVAAGDWAAYLADEAALHAKLAGTGLELAVDPDR